MYIYIYTYREREREIYLLHLLAAGRAHGPGDDCVEALGHFLAAQPQHDSVDEDVFAARDLRVKAGAQLDERRDLAIDLDVAARRLGGSGDDLQQRALAGTVAADHTERLAARDGQTDVVERREDVTGRQRLEEITANDGALQSKKAMGVRHSPVLLDDAARASP